MTTHTAYLVLWIDTSTPVLTQGGIHARVITGAGIYSESHPTSTGRRWPVSLLQATSHHSYAEAAGALAAQLLSSTYDWLHDLLDQTQPDWRKPR